MSDKESPLVVGVGASAGGLNAFQQLLSVLPSDSQMIFILVQHLDPHHRSLLSELLAPLTEMAVKEADHGTTLEPNTVYIIQPDTALAVRDGQIQLSPPTLHRGVRLPVDHLFRSLAKEYGPRSVGIVLSGAGSDGSAGIRDIKNAGGLVIAEDPDASGQRGMPQCAIDTGIVDLVLNISDIPAALARFASMPPAARPSEQPEEEATEEEAAQARRRRPSNLNEQELARLASVLEAQANFDVRVYKPATVERRVLRRMALSGFDTIEPYLEQLQADPLERQTLVRDLLISVTEFFRDPDSFRALRELVIDSLVRQATAGDTIRVWVPGCATGEEAYSLAIELSDAATVHEKQLIFQIFATDVDDDALAVARAGLYPSAIADQISERRLQSYFKPIEGKGYQVLQPLRNSVSFASHDLTKDPPFSRMDLVCCRNVLIYLTAEAQKHVLNVLHFALNPDGHLFLGTSESTGLQRELFATLSKAQSIYRKLGSSRAIRVSRSRSISVGDSSSRSRSSKPPIPAVPRGEHDPARRALIEAIAPPTLIVAEDGSILFSHGDLGPYIRMPEGDNPRFELGSVLRAEIATRVRSVLYKCRREKTPQFATSNLEGQSEPIRIGARPAPSLSDEAVILTFERVPVESTVTVHDRPANRDHDALIEQLERELLATREDLQSTVEELESSNEELRSSSEESMSMNEELQSANEELEATTEELRSLNEELTTVNAQLREKVNQVELAHDDLNNFFSSTKIATLFLDERLCIKRFTPAAQDLLGIEQADNGRFVADIARELLQHDLAKQAQGVLDQLGTTSKDIYTTDGRWIARQVLPYRTENRRIEGVVVTFADVTELRRANEALNRSSRRLELAWEAARGGVFEHRIPLDDTTFVSDQWAQVLGYRRDELPSYEHLLGWLSDQAHPDDRERFGRAYADVAEGRKDGFSLELRFRHQRGHHIWVRKIAKVTERDAQGRARLLRMMIDITDFKEAESSLKESETRFREMADGIPLMVWVHDESGDQQHVNQTFCEFFGVSRDQMGGGRWQMLVHPDDSESYTREFYACVAERRPFHAEARVKAGDGTWRWIESWGRPRWSSDGQFRGLVGTSADVTDRRTMEETLRESESRFRTLADNISQLAWMTDGEGSVVWYNSRWYEYTGTTFEEMKGWGWKAVHHPDHLERVVAKVSQAFETGEIWEDTFPLRGVDGSYRWFLSRAIPIRDEQGRVIRWFGTNTDITDQRIVEEKLRLADRQKDEFLAMLGHELRNPLAAVRTAAAVLRVRSEREPELGLTLQVLDRQTTHMGKLLDGLLDVSRIIRGKIRLQREVLDFCAICREVVSDIVGSIGPNPPKIHVEIPDEPIWVEADRVRLAQIVNNLLSNAVKYTPDTGTIDLILRSERQRGILVIRDTGVGIHADLLPHVFEIFQQSPQSFDRSQGGLGLGLALVKTLTELHRGNVAAKSDGEGKGAEFVVDLPLSWAPPLSARNGKALQNATWKMVLIEDNEDVAEMLKELLELSGHEVTIALEGPSGVATTKAVRPDVVLCDLGLPGGMSGLDVARELRADPELGGIRLVALSGYGRPEDRRSSTDAGFDAHLTKPVDVAAIQDVLAQLAQSSVSDEDEL